MVTDNKQDGILPDNGIGIGSLINLIRLHALDEYVENYKKSGIVCSVRGNLSLQDPLDKCHCLPGVRNII